MAKIIWDAEGQKLYSTGTRHGVLYKSASTPYKVQDKILSNYAPGVGWNGLTGVTETPSGAEANDNYADDIKYVTTRGAENYGFTVEAFMAPDEWAECDGSAWISDLEGIMKVGQQMRKSFGMCHKSVLGNDTQKDLYGYEIHIQYNATASPSERSLATINENPELVTYSWECSCDPVNFTGSDKPTANVIIKCTQDNGMIEVVNNRPVPKSNALAILEDVLYGTATTEPTLPTIDVIMEILKLGSDTTKTAADYARPVQ